LGYNRQLNATRDLKKARILLHATAREYERYYGIQSTEIQACVPDYSFSRIQESFDILQVIRRRRENAIRLCDGLKSLGVEVVYDTTSFQAGFPIAVPIRLRNEKERNVFLEGLFKHGIIGHVQADKWQFFWMSGNMHKGEKEFVAKHILLPINENYEVKHMDHIVTSMEKISKGV
jgi:dTDP-4-amino-4,6-dideoxygalactose transaminase